MSSKGNKEKYGARTNTHLQIGRQCDRVGEGGESGRCKLRGLYPDAQADRHKRMVTINYAKHRHLQEAGGMQGWDGQMHTCSETDSVKEKQKEEENEEN